MSVEHKDSGAFLCWQDRPKELQYIIDNAFQKVAQHMSSAWRMYNGSDAYKVGKVNDYWLVELAIFNGLAKGQKEFNLMDIGAGNFQWSRAVAKHINKHPILGELLRKNKISVSIYNLRAEQNTEESRVKIDNCDIYDLGKFKIENFSDECDRLGLKLTDKVDVMVSHYCFRHLVDPAGTLLQLYEALRPNTGVIALDTFYMKISHRNKSHGIRDGYVADMYNFVANFGAPFVLQAINNHCDQGSIIMQKAGSSPRVPIKYSTTPFELSDRTSASHYCVTNFVAQPGWQEMSRIVTSTYHNFYEDGYTGGNARYLTSTPQSLDFLENLIDSHRRRELMEKTKWIKANSDDTIDEDARMAMALKLSMLREKKYYTSHSEESSQEVKHVEDMSRASVVAKKAERDQLKRDVNIKKRQGLLCEDITYARNIAKQSKTLREI